VVVACFEMTSSHLSDRIQKSREGLENNRCLSRDSKPGNSRIKVTVFIAGADLIGMMKTISRWSYVLTFIRSGSLQFFTVRVLKFLRLPGETVAEVCKWQSL